MCKKTKTSYNLKWREDMIKLQKLSCLYYLTLLPYIRKMKRIREHVIHGASVLQPFQLEHIYTGTVYINLSMNTLNSFAFTHNLIVT